MLKKDSPVAKEFTFSETPSRGQQGSDKMEVKGLWNHTRHPFPS